MPRKEETGGSEGGREGGRSQAQRERVGHIYGRGRRPVAGTEGGVRGSQEGTDAPGTHGQHEEAIGTVILIIKS